MEKHLRALIIAATLVAFPFGGARAVPMESIYNDYPIQCGATYFLFWKGFEEKKNPAMAEVYRKKFESLAARAAQVLEARGLNKKDANAYMQKHIDTLAKIASDDVKPFADFKMLCDQKFSKL